MVLLKRLDSSIAENDTIYAITKACEINNDGRTAGPATPNVNVSGWRGIWMVLGGWWGGPEI